MNTREAILDLCIDDNSELAKNLVRGVFDQQRLLTDNTVKSITQIINNYSVRDNAYSSSYSSIGNSGSSGSGLGGKMQVFKNFQELIRMIGVGVIGSMQAHYDKHYGIDKKIKDKNETIKALINEMQTYNQVFLPDHLQSL